MKINELVKRAYNKPEKTGRWISAESSLVFLMMMLNKLAEAYKTHHTKQPHFFFDSNGKPQGESVELADVVIRIADYFGYMDWNMEAILEAKLVYNENQKK